MSELHTTPERDHFERESPIRAFTDWNVEGCYALGKGFRPSLQHLVPYLNAMEGKEGWRLVQILESATQSPSFLFRSRAVRETVTVDLATTGADELRSQFREAFPEVGAHWEPSEVTSEEVLIYDESGIVIRATTPLKEAKDDPTNPKHYAGRACADLGERLSANGYQILKYVWRLGKKDDECQELGKALWYLDSELALLGLKDLVTLNTYHRAYVKDIVAGATDLEHLKLTGRYLDERLEGQPPFTKRVANVLWWGYNRRLLADLRDTIQTQITYRECGKGLAL